MKQEAIPCAECPLTQEGAVITSEDGRETYRLTMSREDGSLTINGTGECGSSARIVDAEEIEEEAPEMLEAIRVCRGPIQEELAFVRRGGWLGKIGLCKLQLLPAECGAMTQAKTKQFLEQLTTNETVSAGELKNSNCKCK